VPACGRVIHTSGGVDLAPKDAPAHDTVLRQSGIDTIKSGNCSTGGDRIQLLAHLPPPHSNDMVC
jgi:hypothetical protein